MGVYRIAKFIDVIPGNAPAQSMETQDVQLKCMPVFFIDAEWAFAGAAVARLIPADAQGHGGGEAGVPVFIDRQLDMPYGRDPRCASAATTFSLGGEAGGSSHEIHLEAKAAVQSLRLLERHVHTVG
jgi:hypothetical protein